MVEEKSREHLVLKTLSFYEPMNYAQIIFELDSEELKSFPDFTDEQLKEILHSLVKRKLVKKLDRNGDVYWQKEMPRRSKGYISQLFRYLKSFFKISH